MAAAAAAAAEAAVATAATGGGLEQEGERLDCALACVQWLGAFVQQYADTAEEGLFRVPPADSTTRELKSAVAAAPGAPRKGINQFVASTKGARGIGECANAVASLLKGSLRSLNQPVLPFAFCTEDLHEYGLAACTDDAKRSDVGANLAQDIVHTVVSAHAACSNETLVTVLGLLGQLLALLCSVTRAPRFRMHSYDLFVPFLPSLCGSRDPLEFVREHRSLEALNNARRKADMEGVTPPQTRLELLITYGHRIWGYMKPSMDNLEDAIVALREYDEQHAVVRTLSVNHVRKRDLIKRMFKPHKWFQTQAPEAPQAPQASQAPHASPSQPRQQKDQQPAGAKIAPAYLSGNAGAVFREHPGLRHMAARRAPSVRLTVASPLSPGGLSPRQAADVGRAIFRRATSSEADLVEEGEEEESAAVAMARGG